jgi:tetratricopeptide (TPR) repeat protein
MGYTQLKLDRTSDSLPNLTASVEIAPTNALFNTYFAELQTRRNEYALALNHLEIASALDPELELVPLVRSKVFMALGLEVLAKQALDASLGSALPTAQDYSDRGQIHAIFGEADLAFLDHEKAIRINPNRAKFYADRGKTSASLGDFDSALTDFNVGIQIDPTDSTSLLNRGALYVILEEYDLAIADLDQFIDLVPRDASAFNARAEAHIGAGDLESAEADFTTAIEIMPANGLYLLNRGNLRGILGDTHLSQNDIETVKKMGIVTTPDPKSFFAAYIDTTPPEEEAARLQVLEAEREILRAIQ